jgi:hypothetical protein
MNGHGGPCPARRITKSKTAAAFARLGGTASTPSAGISGTEGCTLAGLAPGQVDPATPADLGRDRVLCISLRRAPRTCSSHEGPTADRTPRGQPKRWAQRTVPHPQGLMGGTLSLLCARRSGAEDCAPPGGRSPAQFFQLSRTVTLQGGLSCRTYGHRGLCPSRAGALPRASCGFGQAAMDGVHAMRTLRARRTVPLPRRCHVARRLGNSIGRGEAGSGGAQEQSSPREGYRRWLEGENTGEQRQG